MLKYPDITLYKFQLVLEALEDMYLPDYTGAVFRGAFGSIFREAVCITEMKTCDNCIVRSKCSYFNIFETEIETNDIWFLKGVKKVPHPFVIHPPFSKTNKIQKGEFLKLNLTIFGKMINYFPFFVYTFQKMGKIGIGTKRHKYRLLTVNNFSNSEQVNRAYDNADGKILSNYEPIKVTDFLRPAEIISSKVELEFITPWRAQEKGRVLTNPKTIEPELIFKSIIRRYFALSNLFCGSDNLPDVSNSLWKDVKLAKNYMKFYDWERYSSRQQQRIKLGGFTGKLILENVNRTALNLLLIGSKINIGKNTVFGLGEYKLVY